MPRAPRPERRPLNEGRDPLDRYCKSCGALPGRPCTVKGVTSPEDVRTHEAEAAWKRARRQEAIDIIRQPEDGGTVPVGQVLRILRQANRTLIHETR